MEKIRLQKYLAQSGIASRRKAEELIECGSVWVNGQKVTEMGMKVCLSDIIEVNGKRVSEEKKKVYIMLNKPEGFVTTVKDQFGRSTVMDLVKDIDERIYPVGRLDYDTSGLLLLTNDGDFTYRLTHPKHEMQKVYIAEVIGMPDREDEEQFKKGITIENYITSPAVLNVIGSKTVFDGKRNIKVSTVSITIHEGKNRQVRKMCQAIGHPVISLRRIKIGKIELGDLQEGKWRTLSKEEMDWLSE